MSFWGQFQCSKSKNQWKITKASVWKIKTIDKPCLKLMQTNVNIILIGRQELKIKIIWFLDAAELKAIIS
jgi:hypothetical protein